MGDFCPKTIKGRVSKVVWYGSGQSMKPDQFWGHIRPVWCFILGNAAVPTASPVVIDVFHDL